MMASAMQHSVEYLQSALLLLRRIVTPFRILHHTVQVVQTSVFLFVRKSRMERTLKELLPAVNLPTFQAVSSLSKGQVDI